MNETEQELEDLKQYMKAFEHDYRKCKTKEGKYDELYEEVKDLRSENKRLTKLLINKLEVITNG